MKYRLLFLLLLVLTITIGLYARKQAVDVLMRMELAKARAMQLADAEKQIPRSKKAPTREEIVRLILAAANRYEINPTRFLETAKCESGLNPNIIGDGGYSYGLFQIHLKSHPTVTPEQAKDPYFAIEWSAKKFKVNPNAWTCYLILYGSKPRT